MNKKEMLKLTIGDNVRLKGNAGPDAGSYGTIIEIYNYDDFRIVVKIRALPGQTFQGKYNGKKERIARYSMIDLAND